MNKNNPKLEQIAKSLVNCFTYFKSEDILVIAEDNNSPPFAFITYDPIYPDNLLLSLSVDYHNTFIVADMVITVADTAKLIISDSFYISAKTGDTYFNQDAEAQFEAEFLAKIEAEGKQMSSEERSLAERPALSNAVH